MRCIKVIFCLLVILAGTISARTPIDRQQTTSSQGISATPAYCIAEHNVGKIAVGVTNTGAIGIDYSSSGSQDCFTGEQVAACEYPKGSGVRYLFGGALWIGGIMTWDTVVSVGQDGWTGGAEFHPDESPIGNMRYRSTTDPSSPAYQDAISEQDYIAVYTDTFTGGIQGLTIDAIARRAHYPLQVEVTCESYMWSYPTTEDFIILNYSIKNIGNSPLTEIFIGQYIDGDVHHTSNIFAGYTDDISGFIASSPNPLLPASCQNPVDMNIAWIADNDGDLLSQPGWEAPNVTGMSILATPNPQQKVSYNWWVSNGNPALDYGPMTYDHYRDFSTGGTGTPEGDRNKYWLLSRGEVDFDQVFTASLPDDDPIWMPTTNSALAQDISDGFDTRYLISVGPFDINPGEAIPLTLAFVAGEGVHTDPDNISNLPVDPNAYFEGIDMSDLQLNRMIAAHVYDNPGVDTDSDGYAGEFTVCNEDTIFITGDGVPDFRASNAPAAPEIHVDALPSGLRVSWNAYDAIISRDVISQEEDFEGFNVRLTPGTNIEEMAIVASYDVENFYKYFWNPSYVNADKIGGWVRSDIRFTPEELVCLYAPSGCIDPTWSPLSYRRLAPFVMPEFPDSIFYFETIGCNNSTFGWDTGIRKVYPLSPKPLWRDPSMVPSDSIPIYLTDVGKFKYYEYHYTASNLLPNQEYTIAVTSFDYGSMVANAWPLESPIEQSVASVTTLAGKASCCMNKTGNIDGDPLDQVDISDLTRMIDFLFINMTPLACIDEANIDGDPNGMIDIGDLTLLIDHLFISGNRLPECSL